MEKIGRTVESLEAEWFRHERDHYLSDDEVENRLQELRAEWAEYNFSCSYEDLTNEEKEQADEWAEDELRR